MSNEKKECFKNINKIQEIGRINKNFIKSYTCYNETLQYNKKSTFLILEELNKNYIQHKRIENIRKMDMFMDKTNFSTWDSSLLPGINCNKRFSTCGVKICLSSNISKVDIKKIFHCPKRLIPPKKEPFDCKEDTQNWIKTLKADINENNPEKRYQFEEMVNQKYKREQAKPLPFKTARDELELQNNKISKASSKQFFEYGNPHKTLGTRRTPRSEFVPPIKKETLYSNKFSIKKTNEEIIRLNDRLYNIDPKMIDLINNEVINNLENISWDDVAGLEYAKSIIKETIIWPILRPDIFTGIRRPPKGILLFGPPGTGKTLIGKCIASQSKSKFFSISASSLTSKWIGEGEKMVRALFAVACADQPSIIFVDEIDSLLCQRSESEHESSRRLKTEFLVQLDGTGTSKDDRVLIIGATNRPQELDEAARRRFVKRLYIALPNEYARIKMLQNLLKSVKHTISTSDFEIIGKLTNNYSGADIASLCQEACMEPLRAIPINEMLYFDKNNVRPVTLEDFQDSVKKIRPSVSPNDLIQYLEWDKLYGSGM